MIDTPTTITAGETISLLRKRHKVTYKQLVDKVGGDVALIKNLEKNRNYVTINDFTAIMEALGYDVSLTYKQRKEPQP